MVVALALALTVAGCVCLYLASPNQKWLAQAPPGKALLVAAGVLLAAGLVAWIAGLRPLSGFFVTLHVAMVCLFAFPYLAALFGVERKN
jgi:drug/metabolite transporter (DMT)-like permease